MDTKGYVIADIVELTPTRQPEFEREMHEVYAELERLAQQSKMLEKRLARILPDQALIPEEEKELVHPVLLIREIRELKKTIAQVANRIQYINSNSVL